MKGPAMKNLFDGRTPNDYQKGTGKKRLFNLEPVTISLLEQMAKKDGVCQSEALRNCIRER